MAYSIDEFAGKIKEKYPEYKDKDNVTLVNAIVAKYPEYKDKVDLAPKAVEKTAMAPVSKPDAFSSRVMTGPEGEPVYMPTAGEAEQASKVVHAPSRAIEKYSKKALGFVVPDAKTTSVTANVLMNAPKAIAEFGLETAAGMATPEGAIMAMMGVSTAKGINKETSYNKMMGNIKKVMDLGKKMDSDKFAVMPKIESVLGEVYDDPVKTTQSLRDAVTGIENSQIIRGRYVTDTVKSLVPNELDRKAMYWFKEAKGKGEILGEKLKDAKYKDLKPELERAIEFTHNMPDNVNKAIGVGEKYYKDSGALSKNIGTIRGITENYQNRIYNKNNFPTTEITGKMSDLKSQTGHARARVYETAFDAIEDGKTFATTDFADVMTIHNQEMAKVNSSRRVLDYMSKKGIGGWLDERDKLPNWSPTSATRSVPVIGQDGKTLVDELGQPVFKTQKFWAPPGIASGMKAITEPDLIKQVGPLKKIMKAQAIVKTGKLAMSFFHHFTIAAQSLYQGNVGPLLTAVKSGEYIKDPDFLHLESDFAKHTGMTAAVEYPKDVLGKIIGGHKELSSISKIPAIKQIIGASKANSDFLFGKMHRYIKVMDYGMKMSNWIGDHPNATKNELISAKRGMAKQINFAYGGLNWKSLGIGKTQLSAMRLAFLAPDWLTSNALYLGHAIRPNLTDVESVQTKKALATSLVGGMMLTEFMNKAFTGHFTDKNEPGHEMEIQVSPGAYVSLLRGGPGEAVKVASMWKEEGPLVGTKRYLTGKASPFLSTAVQMWSNKKYSGAAVSKRNRGPVMSTADYLKFGATEASPIPFGLPNLFDYAQQPRSTLPGVMAIGSGIGRYSKVRK